jgi:dienelactone hydrolase
LTSKGVISILVEYRTKEGREIGNNDAKASIKYISENIQNLKIDPRKIVYSGGSRGGGLALSLGLNKAEGLKAFAYVLFNPGVKAGFDTIPKATAPMIIFQGLDDHTVLPEYVEAFKNRVVKKGGKCRVLYYEGQGHGFSNFKTGVNPYFKQTLMSADAFLSDLGLFKPADYSNKNWYLGDSLDK